jgi:hypothetical protein
MHIIEHAHLFSICVISRNEYVLSTSLWIRDKGWGCVRLNITIINLVWLEARGREDQCRIIVLGRLKLMGAAANGVFFVDAFKRWWANVLLMLAPSKGLADPVCWEPGMVGAAEWMMRGMM